MAGTTDQTGLTDHDLASVRALQALAYRCAEEVGASLTPGVTEREAARRMRSWLAERGVDDFFHAPFAWFGPRTTLRWRNPLRFAPTDMRLAEGMPFILDLAPLSGGWVADIGYASALGAAPVQAQILRDLKAHRELILDGVRAGERLSDIYRAVAQLAARQGNEVRHSAYPGKVLAHRVDKITSTAAPRYVGGLGMKGIVSLGKSVLAGVHPFWNGSRRSAHTATAGLWAVEPHLAKGDVGAKFEELLVVTDRDAYWLDDDLPHVRRWRAAEAATPDGARSVQA